MDFTALLQQGNGWLFIPSAVLLGALHGLEPGHSKTMMAAFIVSIKGTTKQAVILGLAAAFSHTIVVWLIALGGMYVSKQFTAQAAEPWMLLISGVIVISTGIWMIWKTWNGERTWQKSHSHSHDFDAHFHEHSHLSEENNDKEYQDAHERAHALDIQKRFMNQTVTNGQILLFGLTGGLIPCPAAVTVLLICLQLKTLVLGSTLVLSFSIGLALTLVSVGVIAAVGVKKATRKWSRLNDLARIAPYFSGALICVVGLYMGIHGYSLFAN